MAALNAQTIVRAGLQATLVAATSGGDTIPVGDNVILVLNNGSGSSITATVVTPGTEGGLAIADQTIVVPAGARVNAGPFPAELFADPTDGRAHVTYSAVTSLTVGVLRLS